MSISFHCLPFKEGHTVWISETYLLLISEAGVRKCVSCRRLPIEPVRAHVGHTGWSDLFHAVLEYMAEILLLEAEIWTGPPGMHGA